MDGRGSGTNEDCYDWMIINHPWHNRRLLKVWLVTIFASELERTYPDSMINILGYLVVQATGAPPVT